MKKKKIIILMLLSLMILTGCTKQLKSDNKVVTFEETGQVLTSNILCKPENESLLEEYEKYDDDLKVSLDDLPTCKSFTPNKIKYVSLWETIFVKPIAYLILKLGYLVKDMGLSVILIGLILRLILMPFQFKTLKQSENMKKIQPEMEKIERKYRNKTDNESLMMKSQETMALYKKYNISPLSSCLTAFIQLPILIGFIEAVQRVPAIFEGTTFFGINLGMTPAIGISKGHWIYIVILLLIIFTTYLSFKNSMSSSNQNPEMAKQMRTMFIFMIVMISFTSLSLSSAIALYWIATNGFAVIQNIIIKKVMERRK